MKYEDLNAELQKTYPGIVISNVRWERYYMPDSIEYQLAKARQEIADYAKEHYPHGECDKCGFALDENGNCTRGVYVYDR